MDINKAIQAIGLSETEADIYLAALGLGESTISDIANKAHMNRSSCYEGIKKLIALGLLKIFPVGSRKFYKTESPDKFLKLLEEKEAMIKEALPQLKSRQNKQDRKPVLYTYQGQEGFKAVLDDILEKQYPLSAVTSIDTALSVLGEDFKDFIEKRYRKHLKVRLMTDRTEKSMELKKKDSSELRVTKFLPRESVLTTANFIYGDRIAIVSLIGKNPFSIIIEDPAIVQTYMTLFEIAWNNSLG